jgi:hypothetical protein
MPLQRFLLDLGIREVRPTVCPPGGTLAIFRDRTALVCYLGATWGPVIDLDELERRADRALPS